MKILSAIGVLGSLLATYFFSSTWWERSQMPYNQEGKFFDGLVVWREHSVDTYGFLSVISVIFLVVMAIIYWNVSGGKNR